MTLQISRIMINAKLMIFLYIQSRTNVNSFMMALKLFGALPYWRGLVKMQLNWFRLDLLNLCIVC